MKKTTILTLLFILINFVICSNAFAYIDPGTGSILLQLFSYDYSLIDVLAK